VKVHFKRIKEKESNGLIEEKNKMENIALKPN